MSTILHVRLLGQHEAFSRVPVGTYVYSDLWGGAIYHKGCEGGLRFIGPAGSSMATSNIYHCVDEYRLFPETLLELTEARVEIDPPVGQPPNFSRIPLYGFCIYANGLYLKITPSHVRDISAGMRYYSPIIEIRPSTFTCLVPTEVEVQYES